MIERLTVEAEQIEHEIDQCQPVTPPSGYVLKMLKTGAAIGQDDSHFAVEQSVSRANLCGGVTNLREPVCPILAAPADQRGAFVEQAATDPVPIELDLVQPVVAARGLRDERGQ